MANHGDVSVTSGTASRGIVLSALSPITAKVSAGTLTADALVLSAPGSVMATQLNVGLGFVLAGNFVKASVQGASDGVGGAVTGYGGGIASGVDLILYGNEWFTLDAVKSALASIEVRTGALAVANTTIVDKAKIFNPQTKVIVDQHNWSFLPADVQLYSGGLPFWFKIWDNKVASNAFLIHSDPQHEVTAPPGTDFSADRQGYAAMANLNRPSVSLPPPFGSAAQEGNVVEPLSFSGVPVSLAGEDQEEE